MRSLQGELPSWFTRLLIGPVGPPVSTPFSTAHCLWQVRFGLQAFPELPGLLLSRIFLPNASRDEQRPGGIYRHDISPSAVVVSDQLRQESLKWRPVVTRLVRLRH
jgi:hypothetical protein